MTEKLKYQLRLNENSTLANPVLDVIELVEQLPPAESVPVEEPVADVPVTTVMQQFLCGPSEDLRWRRDTGASSEFPYPMPHQTRLPEHLKAACWGDEHPWHLDGRSVFKLDEEHGFLINTNSWDAVNQNQAALEKLFAKLPIEGAVLVIVGWLALRYFVNPFTLNANGAKRSIPIALVGLHPGCTIVGCDPNYPAVSYVSHGSYVGDHPHTNIRYSGFNIVGRARALYVDGSGGEVDIDNITAVVCSKIVNADATPLQFARDQFAVHFRQVYGNRVGKVIAYSNHCEQVLVEECNNVDFSYVQARNGGNRGIVMQHCGNIRCATNAEYNHRWNYHFLNCQGLDLHLWAEGRGFVKNFYNAQSDKTPPLTPSAKMEYCSGVVIGGDDPNVTWELDAHSRRLVRFLDRPEEDFGQHSSLVTTDLMRYFSSDNSWDGAFASDASTWGKGLKPTVIQMGLWSFDAVLDGTVRPDGKSQRYGASVEGSTQNYLVLSDSLLNDAPEVQPGELLEVWLTATPQNEATWQFVWKHQPRLSIAPGINNFFKGGGKNFVQSRYRGFWTWQNNDRRPGKLRFYAQALSATNLNIRLWLTYNRDHAYWSQFPAAGELHHYRFDVDRVMVHK